MSWGAIAEEVIKLGAPVLGSLIGGPVGPVLSAGELIAKVFSGDTNNSQDLLAKIQQDPDAKVKLAQIEAQVSTTKLNDSVSLAQIDEQDRENARNRQISLKDHAPFIIGIMVLIGFFIYLFMSVFDAHYWNTMIFTSIFSMASSVVGYFLGSCHQVNGGKNAN